MSAPHVFDRALLRHRRRRARALGAATFLIDRTAADLAERLSTVLRRVGRAGAIGPPTVALRRAPGGGVASLIDGAVASGGVPAPRGARVVPGGEAGPRG